MAIYRLGRWLSSWLANSTPAKWACRSRLNGHSGWPWPNQRDQPLAQPQHLDLSSTPLSPQLWPNRQVATLLVSYNFTTQFTNVSSNNNNIKLP